MQEILLKRLSTLKSQAMHKVFPPTHSEGAEVLKP